MSLDKTLFIGTATPKPVSLPLKAILDHYAVIRDAMARTGCVKPHDLPTLVVNTSFNYAFNAYKSISLLLPELYHESGAAVLRQLWEVSLNLHWIGVDPESRSQDFCNFTIMEHRKLISRSGDPTELQAFDADTKRLQERFQYQTKKKRIQRHEHFSKNDIYDRASKLGDPWNDEYQFVFRFASMHVHGAPGAVLRDVFQTIYTHPKTREQNSASLIAILAIKVMVRNGELLVTLDIIPDASKVMEAFKSFQETIPSEGTKLFSLLGTANYLR